MYFDRCCGHRVCGCVRLTGVANISVHICVHARYRVCICAFMYVQFVHSALERGWRVELDYESTCCLAWGIIYDRRRDRDVVCVFSIFNADGSVCGRRCVYTHIHTHTTHMGYSDVSYPYMRYLVQWRVHPTRCVYTELANYATKCHKRVFYCSHKSAQCKKDCDRAILSLSTQPDTIVRTHSKCPLSYTGALLPRVGI